MTRFFCLWYGLLVFMPVMCVAAQTASFSWDPVSTNDGPPATVLEASPAVFSRTGQFPPLVWPIGQALGDGTFLSNYFDNAPETGVLLDYQGGTDHLYDGHRGTDIAIYNFRLMDRGVPIVAAASGTVISTTYHYGDRNTGLPYPDGGNGFVIRHDDGTIAYYWHIRTNSIMVEPGERVEAGQPLAYVGSSGWTPIPHLHFELVGNSVPRDPWAGPFNPESGLWMTQPAYVGNAPLWVMDMDVFTLGSVGGSLNRITDAMLKERLDAPAVFGADEPTLAFWIQLQGNRGDRYTLDVIQPDGQLFAQTAQVLTQKRRYGWDGLTFEVPADMPPGTWTARITSGGEVLYERAFEVGLTTEFAPRFVPVAGRSVRMGGEVYQETLQVSDMGSAVMYHMVDAPGNIELDGETLTISPASDQPYRSRYVQVVATDAEARTDTLWFHLVDPSKPFNPPTPVSVEETPAAVSLSLHGFPNPFTESVTLGYHLSQAGRAALAVFDVLGREVTSLANQYHPAGTFEAVFAPSSLPGGLYFARLTTPNGMVVRPLVYVR